ncbi:MAG: hypothetical protein EOO77_44945, partial [Oxalobacteraceae bacterium]
MTDQNTAFIDDQTKADHLTAIRGELLRLLDGGTFNEAFFQRLFGPSRDEMHRLQRERDGELSLLRAEVTIATAPASTGDVRALRELRKAERRVKKFEGVLRARKSHRAIDPINAEWQRSVAYISSAREAAVHIQRIHH